MIEFTLICGFVEINDNGFTYKAPHVVANYNLKRYDNITGQTEQRNPNSMAVKGVCIDSEFALIEAEPDYTILTNVTL